MGLPRRDSSRDAHRRRRIDTMTDHSAVHPTPAASTTWALLEQALVTQRRVQVRYKGHNRVICPHVLGWKNNQPKVLAYQLDGETSQGPLPEDPSRRWRSMLINDIDHATIIDGNWQTAPNYTPVSNNIDTIAVHH